MQDSPSEVLQMWALEETSKRSAQLIIHPTKSESVYRGRPKKDGLSYVDIIQAALDVAFHPARGEEQARYLTESVLGWAD